MQTLESKVGWKNHPDKQRKSEHMRNYLVLHRSLNRTPSHAAEKMQQATRQTKWRRKESKRGWTAAGRKDDCGDETERTPIDGDY